MTNLPDFLVIGAMKCGTTSLQNYLASHPEIALAPKELNFFSKPENWSKGEDWYKSFFDKPDRIQGEICPGYTKRHLYRDVPERIFNLVPEVRLIYILREPVSRVISHFNHGIGADTTTRSADEIFRDSVQSYVDTSRYAYQLEEYLRFFSRDQILIVTAEDLAKHRQNTLQVIFRFLCVNDNFSSDKFDSIFHDSSLKVRRNFAGRMFAKYPALKKVESGAKSAIPRRLHPVFARLLGKSLSKPELSSSQLDTIRRRLGDDLDQLRRLTGVKFEGWNE